MRRPKVSWLTAALILAASAVAPGSALAAANHPFLGIVGSPTYEDACGVASSPGALYVSDYYHDAIVTPGGSLTPAGGPCKLALDSGGDLYVNEWHQAVVRYPASELLPGAREAIDEAQPTGVAVRRSTGDVFVAHRTYVSEYSSAGELLATIGAGSLGEAYGVAVSEYPATAGYLYVPDAASRTVKVFNPEASLTAPVEEITGAGTPQGSFKYLVDSEVVVDNLAASPSYGHVYVLDSIGHGLSERPEAALDEFNAEGDYRGQILGFIDAEPSGVAIEAPAGNVLVTSGNSEGSAVFRYGPTSFARLLEVVKSGAGGGTVTSSPAGIACGEACSAEFNEGQRVTLFAIPDGHSAFAGWTVTGAEPCPGAGSCTVQMGKQTEVTAQFEQPTQEPLTVGVGGSGQGAVTSDPVGIECPGSCEEHFAQGRVVTLTADPGPHSRFVGWGGPDCDESVSLTCKVEMTGAKAVAAQFEPIQRLSLAVTRSGSGQGTVTSYPTGISCPGACAAEFDEGSTAYLMAAPAPGSEFGGFSGGGCSGTATICAVPISAATAVNAEFAGAARGPGVAALAAGGALRVAGLQTRGPLAAVRLTASEPGVLVAAGDDLRGRKIELVTGSRTVRLRLNRHGARLLRRRHRLAVQLSLGFLPADTRQGRTMRMPLRFRSAQRNFDRKGR